MYDPRMRHLQVVGCVIQYLKISGSLNVVTYVDADYAGLMIDKKITSVYCTFLCT